MLSSELPSQISCSCVSIIIMPTCLHRVLCRAKLIPFVHELRYNLLATRAINRAFDDASSALPSLLHLGSKLSDMEPNSLQVKRLLSGKCETLACTYRYARACTYTYIKLCQEKRLLSGKCETLACTLGPIDILEHAPIHTYKALSGKTAFVRKMCRPWHAPINYTRACTYTYIKLCQEKRLLSGKCETLACTLGPIDILEHAPIHTYKALSGKTAFVRKMCRPWHAPINYTRACTYTYIKLCQEKRLLSGKCETLACTYSYTRALSGKTPFVRKM